ncbi:tpr domain-containing [Lecanosticta acicola]|uniref:Tpr domain-containing n=1 Tax=Lecanosticta acicola TaxID=111012 RepID=A0AAI8W1T9_9PEZI|nr:tpr domain-containing [Lecanosticta acicola]
MAGRLILGVPLRQAYRNAFRHSRSIHFAMPRPRAMPIRVQHASGSAPRRFKGTFMGNARVLFHKHPFSMTLATAIIFSGFACIMWVNYIYQTYIIGAFHKYPEPVAKQLRKALYYTNMDLQPKEALKFYRKALEVSMEVGMDPFSDEIMGVKIQVAKMLEDIQQWPKAIEVLERVRHDNLVWLELRGDLEGNKLQRTNVLAKTVAVCVKLGDLYGHPAVWNRDMAQERVVWAVDTALKEKQRRQNNNVKEEDEGRWVTDEELGASLESLAHSYEAKDQHYLAAPLFLQALSLYPTKDCHSVVLMNNLASSLAQQSPRAAREIQAYATSQNLDEQPAGPTVTRETMVENAEAWAQKALDVAATIQPPIRNEECDLGCAVALHNLGEFAEMSKDVELAKKKYKEAVSLARAIGFEEGVEQSSARLRELAKAGWS